MARLLVVTSRVPYPPREGHQLRSWHVLRALARRHEVKLLSFARADDELHDIAPLRDLVAHFETFEIPADRSRVALAGALMRGLATSQPFVAAKYASAPLRARIAELAPTIDIAHFDMLPLMAYADAVPRGVPVVLNAHNVEHALLERRVDIETSAAARFYLRTQIGRLREFERAACARADLVLACSDDDARQLRALAPNARIETVPNGVDLDANRPDASAPAAPNQIVFVGQMGWFPNRDGVEWFLADVFPRILAARADAEFVLVGKSDGLKIPDAIRNRVTLAGFVPDLRPYVHRAAVYVVPLRAGSGTRLKVLEAMALGKAIVTTTIGSEGIALVDGRSAAFADTATAFADAVLRLLTNRDEAARLGVEARALAESRYGWDAIGDAMLPAYDELLRAKT